MSGEEKNVAVSPHVQLAYVEINRFRRLGAIELEIDPQTTILVGANNSGKTSILLALRKFLADSPAFGAFDLSVDQWSTLRRLGEVWEALDEPPASSDTSPQIWHQYLQDLLATMPTLDLWFNAQAGAYHVVSPFLPSLRWAGGAVGVRLRLEPATTIDDLQQLAWRYREARQLVRSLDSAARPWPTDLLDYWLRFPGDLSHVIAYRLDPAKGPLSGNPSSKPQDLSPYAKPIERTHLSSLIKVNFIAAQRGLGSEEADARPGSDPHRVGLFSNQMLQYARRHLNSSTSGAGHHPELVLAVANAQGALDEKIRAALEPSIKDVRKLGYPGLHDPQEIHFRTRIQTADLLDHSTAVQYRLDGQPNEFLPEHAIGLGYQNLQSLSYQLVSFRETRLRPEKGAPAAVHLVLIEEPEAHLHVQVQRIFPKRAFELITPKEIADAHLSSQILLSTHSSHMAHSGSFSRLRYVRRVRATKPEEMPSAEVINLADTFGADAATRIFAERYFQVQHTDLLFADAAIFVEGTAERMLVPFFIDRDFEELSSRYLSFLGVGGSHAHRLKPLVERLGIPTVVITDIDPVSESKSEKGKTTWVATAISDSAILTSANDTLAQWHPQLKNFSSYAELKLDEKIWTGHKGNRVLFAWQVPIPVGGPWPSSFEDSFILTNLEWFKSKIDEKGALGRAAREVEEHSDLQLLNLSLHKMLRGSFKKGDFAATLFEQLSLGAPLACPGYITDALAWLESELNPVSTGEQP
ncbi:MULTISPECIES: AAA family ATPase [Pseudomonas]|uniref:ATP-dependent endonuclease n=1 Tax=Pseudomonas mosselii TaxID=78327 RepID=A0A5R8ZJD0_9PSED|nr:AAA family ATPase [Pseudomonas mosselii]TLP64936.1 ATP-dependent endonuclease [Pseudomonas mosselii]